MLSSRAERSGVEGPVNWVKVI